MQRLLFGTLIARSSRDQFIEIAHDIVGVLEPLTDDLPISHFYSGHGFGTKFKKWSTDNYEKLTAEKTTDTIELISNLNGISAGIATGADYRFQISITTARGPQCLLINYWIARSLFDRQRDAIIRQCDHIAKRIRAASGHMHDFEDFADQNQCGPTFFEMSGKKFDRRKLRFSKVLGQTIIDIEQNPCHNHVFEEIDFCSSWTVYLGNRFLELSGKEAIDAESLGASVIHVGDGVWRITLFQDPFDFDAEENQNKLWEFRRLFRVDDVAHELVEPLF